MMILIIIANNVIYGISEIRFLWQL